MYVVIDMTDMSIEGEFKTLEQAAHVLTGMVVFEPANSDDYVIKTPDGEFLSWLDISS